MQYFILIILFLFLPVLGLQEIGKGNIVGGILYLLPLLCLIAYLIYYRIYTAPKKMLSDAACKKFNLPKSYLINGDSWKWDKKIHLVIEKVLKTETDPEKNKELKTCSDIVSNIHKGPQGRYSGFSDIDRAFILTGCHVKIIDDKGETVTQIV